MESTAIALLTRYNKHRK